jgi:hypothetical protein
MYPSVHDALHELYLTSKEAIMLRKSGKLYYYLEYKYFKIRSLRFYTTHRFYIHVLLIQISTYIIILKSISCSIPYHWTCYCTNIMMYIKVKFLPVLN